jgi:hypothetical protein
MFVIILMFQDLHFSKDGVRWLCYSENGILLHRARCFGSQDQVLLVLKIHQNWCFEVLKNTRIHTHAIICRVLRYNILYYTTIAIGYTKIVFERAKNYFFFQHISFLCRSDMKRYLDATSLVHVRHVLVSFSAYLENYKCTFRIS